MKGKGKRPTTREAHEMRMLKSEGWALREIAEKYDVSIRNS